MKLITLTKGCSVQVDDWWYDYLMQWKWYALKGKLGINYAARNIPTGYKKQTLILMHRVIMNTPDGLMVDHIDHNGLNCLEENMRNCSHTQNTRNRRARGRSKYLGVSINREGKITAGINIEGKSKHLGIFLIEEDAARAYDRVAKELYGVYANPNFPNE